ncbi:Signal peptidase I [Pseudobythopirellula maris]|uniref:Signal peptidase I n=1 Tax=Pseudobythopirellula maris TaxID=2527991 RepID=A0A5C5ZI26_9BACT|nr:signal peptidase I [Pseudobythopirellula maris]TWT86775.1 Signal peptidase I [Pseudobythopirellula maris]
MTTAVLVVMLVGLLALQIFLWFAGLRFGLSWVGAERITVGRLFKAALLVLLLNLAVNAVWEITPGPGALSYPAGLLIGYAISILAQWLVIAKFFRLGWLKSAIASSLPILAPIVTVLFVLLVSKPYFFEGFTPSTNSMAPTLLGEHSWQDCPVCGAPAYGSLFGDRSRRRRPVKIICDQFHVTQSYAALTEGRSDRVFFAKYLRPSRWDMVVFRPPSNPATFFVKRLVGMPGETITIKDGAVWADGKRLDPPDDLEGLEYVTKISGFRGVMWGDEDNPASLGEGEYFMLGDFSSEAFDSRLWSEGAPGRPPFAVPSSHIVGVATHVYWPPERWRIIR